MFTYVFPGFNDPSCTLTVETTTSAVSAPKSLVSKPKSINLAWNQTLQFTVTNQSSVLYVQFFDNNDFDQATKIGEVVVPLSTLSRGLELVCCIKHRKYKILTPVPEAMVPSDESDQW